MGKKQSRYSGPQHREHWVRAGRCRQNVRWWVGGLRVAIAALMLMALSEQGTVSPRLWAQQDGPARPAAAKSDAPGEAARSDAATESSQVTAESLSFRYRFIEKYSPTEDPAHPELITQYRVGMRETQKIEREKAQGAPDRSEISHQTIYTERAARVGKLGEALSAVRRYDRFQRKEPATLHPATPPLFEGLTIWLKRQSGKKPLVLSLTADRPLRDFEFAEITKQLFVPQLPALFHQRPGASVTHGP